MKKLQIGIVGLGDISDVYINNLKRFDVINILACASRGLEKAKAKAETHGIKRPFTLTLTLPLTLFGARFSLGFAAHLEQPVLPADTFLPQNWLTAEITDLADFTHQIKAHIQQPNSPHRSSPIAHSPVAPHPCTDAHRCTLQILPSPPASPNQTAVRFEPKRDGNDLPSAPIYGISRATLMKHRD